VGSHLYRHTLDEKQRLMVPVSFRNKMGDAVALTKGFPEKCLQLFSMKDWEEKKEKIRAQSSLTNTAVKLLERHLVGSAYEGVLDKQGRIVIPTELREYANITKDVVVTELNDIIEIWDVSRYDQDVSAMEFTPEILSYLEGLDL